MEKFLIMNISHIEHIGIAVKDLQESIKYYENVLGFKCYSIEEVPEQKVKTAFFMVGQTKIELLESTDPEGPIGKFIEKKGEGIHHLAFATKDLEGALQEVEKLKKAVESRLNAVESLFAELSPALAVHTGPGTAGLCYFPVE